MAVRKLKEKCKNAARVRRERERIQFNELSRLLPLPSNLRKQLDKASVIRLTSSYLHLRLAFPNGLGRNWGSNHQAPIKNVKHIVQHRHKQPKIDQTGEPGLANIITATRTTDRCISRRCDSEATNNEHSTSIKNGDNLENELIEQHNNEALNCYDGQDDCSSSDASSVGVGTEPEIGSMLLQTLEGFVFALHQDGKIIYISETASTHLGLAQIDLTGSSIYDYLHPADHDDINKLFVITDLDRLELNRQLAELSSDPLMDKILNFNKSSNTIDNNNCKTELETDNDNFNNLDNDNNNLNDDGKKLIFELNRSFTIRMRCILPKRNAGLVFAGYKTIHCNGYLKVRATPDTSRPVIVHHNMSTNNQLKLQTSVQTHRNISWVGYALVAVGYSLPSGGSTEVRLNPQSYMFRTRADLRFIYVDPGLIMELGYDASDFNGATLYQFVHPKDLRTLEKLHRLLLDKGQFISPYFRIIREGGDSYWVQCTASFVSNQRGCVKSRDVVYTCSIISRDEQTDDQSNARDGKTNDLIKKTSSNSRTTADFTTTQIAKDTMGDSPPSPPVKQHHQEQLSQIWIPSIRQNPLQQSIKCTMTSAERNQHCVIISGFATNNYCNTNHWIPNANPLDDYPIDQLVSQHNQHQNNQHYQQNQYHHHQLINTDRSMNNNNNNNYNCHDEVSLQGCVPWDNYDVISHYQGQFAHTYINNSNGVIRYQPQCSDVAVSHQTMSSY